MMWEYLSFLSSKSSFSCGDLTFYLSFWLVGRQAIFSRKKWEDSCRLHFIGLLNFFSITFLNLLFFPLYVSGNVRLVFAHNNHDLRVVRLTHHCSEIVSSLLFLFIFRLYTGRQFFVKELFSQWSITRFLSRLGKGPLGQLFS